MEIFAAFGEYTDHEVGRLVQAIADVGQLDNTLIFYIAGDNGASAEGGSNGLFNEMTYFNGVSETVAEILSLIVDEHERPDREGAEHEDDDQREREIHGGEDVRA
jgi:arylsulfatase A-like enzyme